jgi:hypothetical protein
MLGGNSIAQKTTSSALYIISNHALKVKHANYTLSKCQHRNDVIKQAVYIFKLETDSISFSVP